MKNAALSLVIVALAAALLGFSGFAASPATTALLARAVEWSRR